MFFTRMLKTGLAAMLLLFFNIIYADKDSGLYWKGYYNADFWYGLEGGLEDKARYLGKADINLSIDFEKLFNIKKLEGFIEVQNINGQRPNLLVQSIEGVNSIQGFDNIEYDRNSTMTDLYQLWLQKSGEHWSARVASMI